MRLAALTLAFALAPFFSHGAAMALEPTPRQTEGPYYPLTKPQDRDNNLLLRAGAPGAPKGETMRLTGRVLDIDGAPMPGATIEIWQTDASGAYEHPLDPSTESRDRNFQFYGEAVSGADGTFEFLTLFPGLYGGRPRHIHAKVLAPGRAPLTTQIYFPTDAGEGRAGLERMFGARILPLAAELSVVEGGSPGLLARHDFVIE